MRYSGFWKRFWALIIDSLIMLPIAFILLLLEKVDSLYWISVISSVILWWLYFSFFESGERQATPGKRLLQIYVTNLDGQRITFARATGRYFSKTLSAIIFGVGYLMAGFTEKKQALHDMIASTLVIDGIPNANIKSLMSSGFAEPERMIVTSNRTSSKSGRWVLAGFDSNGHVVRLSFDAEDPKLFEDGLILGRDSQSCDLHITDQAISRRHAKIYINNGDIWIEDLGSTNGIFINGKKIRANQSAPFNSSSTLAIGGIELTLGKG